MNHVSKRVSVSVSVYQVKVKRCHEQFVRCIDKKLVSMECHFIFFSSKQKIWRILRFSDSECWHSHRTEKWLCATTTSKKRWEIDRFMSTFQVRLNCCRDTMWTSTYLIKKEVFSEKGFWYLWNWIEQIFWLEYSKALIGWMHKCIHVKVDVCWMRNLRTLDSKASSSH